MLSSEGESALIRAMEKCRKLSRTRENQPTERQVKMSASSQFDDVPISHSRSARLGRSGSSQARSSSRQQSHEASPQMPHTTSRVPDDTNASTRTLVNPPEQATTALHDRRPMTSRADDTKDTQQARGNIKSIDRKLQRLEPPARGDGSSARTRTQSEQHDPTFALDHEERTRTRHAGDPKTRKKSPTKQARSSSPTRKAKVWCGNNKKDKALRINGGHLEIGSPHACFTRGVGGAIHQDIPPGEEEAFLEKWTQPYEKLVSQPIWYKSTPPPHGMFRCTLPQAMQRGFAVGSKKRAEAIVMRRGHTTHGA